MQYISTLLINCISRDFSFVDGEKSRRGRLSLVCTRLRLNNTEPEEDIYTHAA